MYNPNTHKRKNIRLKGYDYSKEGYYFITICTQNRQKILSKIVGAGPVSAQAETTTKHNANDVGAGLVPAQNVKLYKFGKIVENEIIKINQKYKNVKINNYILMPNHIHMIVEIRAGTRPAPTLNDIIRYLKSITTLKYIKEIKKDFDKRVWQRNYYEHIIRNEKELYATIEYIENNPKNWDKDSLNV